MYIVSELAFKGNKVHLNFESDEATLTKSSSNMTIQ